MIESTKVAATRALLRVLNHGTQGGQSWANIDTPALSLANLHLHSWFSWMKDGYLTTTSLIIMYKWCWSIRMVRWLTIIDVQQLPKMLRTYLTSIEWVTVNLWHHNMMPGWSSNHCEADWYAHIIIKNGFLRTNHSSYCNTLSCLINFSNQIVKKANNTVIFKSIEVVK